MLHVPQTVYYWPSKLRYLVYRYIVCVPKVLKVGHSCQGFSESLTSLGINFIVIKARDRYNNYYY